MQLTLDNFTKRFDGVAVIEDMNLTVNDGEMLALLGPSGCGKSTTLFAICGIYRCDGGRIMFGDRDVSHLPSQRRNVPGGFGGVHQRLAVADLPVVRPAGGGQQRQRSLLPARLSGGGGLFDQSGFKEEP